MAASDTKLGALYGVVALFALFITASAHPAESRDEAHPVQVVVLQETTARGAVHTYELQNTSRGVVAYFHWFGAGSAPVPYCLRPDGSVRVCSKAVTLTPEGDYWVHERYLRSGERVKFEAIPNADEVVGVRLWLHGKDVYVWGAR